MLDSAITPRSRRPLLVILASATLTCLTVWGLARVRDDRRDTRTVAHAPNIISLWGPLRELGCAPPNEHGTFIAAKLLPDENGNPYIFECTDDGLLINGVRVR